MANIQSLPYNVLLRIFEICTDFEIPEEYARLLVAVSTRSDDEGLEPFSRVCRSWRMPAQRRLIQRILVYDDKFKSFLATIEGRKDLAYSVNHLTLDSRNQLPPTLARDQQLFRSITSCRNLTQFSLAFQMSDPVLDLSILRVLKYVNISIAASEKAFALTLPASTIGLTVIFLGCILNEVESSAGSMRVTGKSLRTLAVFSARESQTIVASLLESCGSKLVNLSLSLQNPFNSQEGIKAFKSHLSSLKRLHYFLNSRKPIQFDLEAILPRFKKLTALSIPTTAYSKRILGSLPPTLLYLELVQQSTWIPYKILVQTCPVRSSPNAPYLAELSLVANEREHHKVGTESSFGSLRSMLLRRALPIGLQEFFRTKTDFKSIREDFEANFAIGGEIDGSTRYMML